MPSSSRTVDRAAEITYDPSASGMVADDVQGALDELSTVVDAIPAVDESALVHRTGAETIAGLKTFTATTAATAGLNVQGAVSMAGGNLYLGDGYGLYFTPGGDAVYSAKSLVGGADLEFSWSGGSIVHVQNSPGPAWDARCFTNVATSTQLYTGYRCKAHTPGAVAAGFGARFQVQASTTTTSYRDVGDFRCVWADPTDAARKGRSLVMASDWNGDREGLRVEADGTAARIGFLGAAAVARPTGDLGQALVALGLVAAPTATVPYRFGAAGVITTGAKPPLHRARAAGVATRIDLTLSAGTATAAVEASTDGGATWPVVAGSVAVAAGRSATATISTAIPAAALLRVNYTAAAAAADPVVSLYVAEGP